MAWKLTAEAHQAGEPRFYILGFALENIDLTMRI